MRKVKNPASYLQASADQITANRILRDPSDDKSSEASKKHDRLYGQKEPGKARID